MPAQLHSMVEGGGAGAIQRAQASSSFERVSASSVALWSQLQVVSMGGDKRVA